MNSDDPINPDYYRKHPSGVESIEIREWLPANLSDALKYLWRLGAKNNDALTDLRKALWYIDREVQRLRSDHSESDVVFTIYERAHRIYGAMDRVIRDGARFDREAFALVHALKILRPPIRLWHIIALRDFLVEQIALHAIEKAKTL